MLTVRTVMSKCAALCGICTITISSPAIAACDAQNSFKLDWDTKATGVVSKTIPVNYSVTNAAGASTTVTLSFSGDTANLTTINFGGTTGTVSTPYIGVANFGGLASSTEKTLSVGTKFDTFQSNISSNIDVLVTNFAFSTPVRDIQFAVLDIDYAANAFRDWLRITGTGPGGSFVPTISSPYGRNNTSNPGQTLPGVVVIGPYTLSAPNAANGEVVGNGNSNSNQNYGNISVSFAQPVTSVQLRYANGPAAYISGTPAKQAISIHDISFCPMPILALAKTAAPFVTTAGDPARFNAPGSDILYSLTVSNTGGSPVDTSTIVLDDVLPGKVSFYNGDIDGAGPLTSNFEFVAGSSGLTLGTGNLSYSNNGGSSYGYSPISGYDTAVNAVRLRPQGTMAANSSFTVRFRAQIK
jgi:hypothetical protein